MYTYEEYHGTIFRQLVPFHEDQTLSVKVSVQHQDIYA